VSDYRVLVLSLSPIETPILPAGDSHNAPSVTASPPPAFPSGAAAGDYTAPGAGDQRVPDPRPMQRKGLVPCITLLLCITEPCPPTEPCLKNRRGGAQKHVPITEPFFPFTNEGNGPFVTRILAFLSTPPQNVPPKDDRREGQNPPWGGHLGGGG